MLLLSRDGKSGEVKYAHVHVETESVMGLVTRYPPPYPSISRKNDTSMQFARNEMINGFNILLSNIQRKTASSGFVVDVEGMHDRFAAYVFKR